ncbi:MAG: hypothetical protein GY832_36275 [Chloroflexi bacterium]|nr:hypothetical protein [Chloroflexota bacterium]
MSDSDEKKWFRNYGIHIRNTPDKIMSIEKTIARVMNVQDKNRTDAICKIFDAGCKVLKDDPQFGTVELQTSVKKAEFEELVNLRASQKKQIAKAYRVLEPEEIQGIADQVGIDISEVNIYTLPLSLFDNYKNWIISYLADGEVKSIDDVRDSAVHDKILPSPTSSPEQFKREFQNFKQAASELGVSGKHTRRGEWQKVSK